MLKRCGGLISKSGFKYAEQYCNDKPISIIAIEPTRPYNKRSVFMLKFVWSRFRTLFCLKLVINAKKMT